MPPEGGESNRKLKHFSRKRTSWLMPGMQKEKQSKFLAFSYLLSTLNCKAANKPLNLTQNPMGLLAVL